MDGAAAPGFGFGLCAGGDLVTELLRSRLVGLRQKGFTPAAGRQRAADPQSAKEREKDSPLSLWLFTHAAVEQRLTGCGSAAVFTCEDVTRSTPRTRRCHFAQCFEENARIASQRSKQILLEYRRGLEREKQTSRGFSSVLYKKRQKKSREAVLQFSF